MNQLRNLLGLLVALIIVPILVTAQPTLTLPVNGDTGVSIQPYFEWSDSSATQKLQVATDNGFSSIVVDKVITAFDTSYTLTESEKLDNSETYYWRVSIDGGSSWSTTFSFSTIASVSVTLGWPSDNSTVYTTSTLFSWYATSTGSLSFKVQVTSSTNGGNADWTVTPDFEATTSNSYYTFTLLEGKTYYWRVIVLNSNSEVVSYSSEYTFTTAGGAVVPTMSYPTGGDTVYYNPPSFFWYIQSAGTDLTYDIQVDDDSGFSTPEIDVTDLSTLYYLPTSSLDAGTKYYWHVRSVYKRGTGDEDTGSWASTDSFTMNSTTNLSQPILSYPTGGVTVYTTSPYLYWYLNTSSSGISFDVYYKESTAGSFTKANTSAISNLYYQLTSLTEGDTYYWYVTATDGIDTDTSATDTFVVYAASSGTPVATYPTSGETVYSLTPTVYWYLNGSTTGLTKYTVRWKVDDNSTDWDTDYTGTADITDLTTTYYTFTSDLLYGKTYYWAVASYDGSSYSSWSSGSFVVIASSTTAPTLSYPIGGTTVYTTSPTLYWYLNGSSTGVVSYEVHYSKDGFVTSDSTVSPDPTTTSTTLTGLTPGATYSWKVKTYYGNSTYSSFSATETFTIDPGSSPVQPLIGGPNNVSIDDDSPTISWILPVQSESQLTYELEYSTSADMSNSIIVSGINNPFTQLQGLTTGEIYYWRARSKTNSGEYSDFSRVARFNLEQVTSVEEETIPEEFRVWQNYPNPFNPSTVIKFSIPQNSNVKITVFDLLGREIANLIDENMEAGFHKVEFNTEKLNLSSGIYFYKVQANNLIEIRKMVLLK